MKLKQYRTKHHLSVIQLANILELSRQHIYDMERERVYPSRQLALDIEEKLKGEVTARELLNI